MPGFIIRSKLNLCPSRPYRVRHFISRAPRNNQYAEKRNIMWAVVAANVAIFGSWSYAQMKPDHLLQTTLFRNFVLSRKAIEEGRLWTALSCAFSHQQIVHLLFNLVTFYSFSTILIWHPAVSAARYLVLLVGSGVSSSVAYIQYCRMTGSRAPAIGASGIVNGVGAVAACLDPRATFLIYGLVPVPLWAVLGGFVVADTFLLSSSIDVGHSAHLGGLLFGLAYYVVGIRTRLGRRF